MSLAQSAFNYVDLVSESYWVVQMDEVQVVHPQTGQGVALQSDMMLAIIDTGTSLLAGSPALVTKLMQEIGTSTGMVDCNKVADLPVISFVLNNNPYYVPPQAYVIEGEDESG